MHKFRFLLRNIFQNAVRQFQTYLRFGNSCQSWMKNEQNQKQEKLCQKEAGEGIYGEEVLTTRNCVNSPLSQPDTIIIMTHRLTLWQMCHIVETILL